MKTRLHNYSFLMTKMGDREAYNELCERLRQDPDRHFFHVRAEPFGKELKLPDGEYELETKHLFSDQWNGTEYRLFDWYEAIYPNTHLKKGYWLEITDEMRAIRQQTLTCGWCGKNYPPGIDHGTFCSACLDGPHLTEDRLHLLRLLPVAERMPERAELTEAERAELLPRYVERQTTGNDSRAVVKAKKIREDVERKHKNKIEAAETEYRGMTWLLDHGISLENCIYYDHTKLFSFGWREPVADTVANKLLDMLAKFEFQYEIKAASGAVYGTVNARE